jgi:hypothetical protein
MMVKISPTIIALLLISHQTFVYAAPMSFKGSTTTMSTISKSYSSVESSHAITSKDSLGLKAYTSKGNEYKLKVREMVYLRKLLRVNKMHSQTNLWLFTGAGTMSLKKNAQNNNHSYLSPTLQFDYETKNIYGLISHQVLRVGHKNFDTTKIEGGFSFYETSYNETQPWFILKARNANSIGKKNKYTPTLRFINKYIFGEVGITTDGDPSFHLMYTF